MIVTSPATPHTYKNEFVIDNYSKEYPTHGVPRKEFFYYDFFLHDPHFFSQACVKFLFEQ